MVIGYRRIASSSICLFDLKDLHNEMLIVTLIPLYSLLLLKRIGSCFVLSRFLSSVPSTSHTKSILSYPPPQISTVQETAFLMLNKFKMSSSLHTNGASKWVRQWNQMVRACLNSPVSLVRHCLSGLFFIHYSFIISP